MIRARIRYGGGERNKPRATPTENTMNDLTSLLDWLRDQPSDVRRAIAAEMLALYDADANLSRTSGVRFALAWWARA